MLSRRPANRFHRGRFGGAPGFSGNFASLFTSLGLGPLQVWQTDLGMVYGPATLAQGTSVVAGTLSGTLTGPNVPLLFTCTNAAAIGSGALFSLSVDGGSTQIMTGINPAAGVPVALTGAASGLSHAWAAGSAALDNTWTATGTSLVDQSGNGKTESQASAPLQPIVTPGFGSGKVGWLYDGSNDFTAALLNLPAPCSCLMVFRLISWTIGKAVIGTTVGTNAAWITRVSSPGITPQVSITGTNNMGATLNNWTRGLSTHQNTIADVSRFGASNLSGTATGAGVGTGCQTAANGGTLNSNIEVVMKAYFSTIITPAQEAVIDAAISSFYPVPTVLV